MLSDSIAEYEDAAREVKRVGPLSDDEDFSSEAEASGDLFLPIDGPITETEKPYKG